MACRNIVRYFSGYEADQEEMLDGEENQNNISSYKLSDNLEDTISPQNAKQLVVDSKMTDVIFTWDTREWGGKESARRARSRLWAERKRELSACTPAHEPGQSEPLLIMK